MADKHGEEEQMRAVALQNAQSIFLARQRAERDLIAAKEALESTTQELSRQHEWTRVTLASIGDAVITADIEGNVTFLNPTAETLTGWKASEARGQPVASVFQIINDRTREPALSPVAEVLRLGRIVGLANQTTLIARDGRETPIEDSAAPIRDADDRIVGVVMVFHDVTRRRGAEIALRESETRLQQAMEAGQMGAWEWIVASGKVIWSPTLEAIHGLLPGNFGGSFEDFQRDMHPEDRDAVLKTIQESVESRADYRNEYRIIKPDGSVAWIEARGKILTDDRGNLERMAGICMDITARKQVEEVRARLAAVIEFSDDAIVSKTLDGIITTWNAGAERMFGYAAEEIVGRPVTLLIPQDRADEEPQILSKVRRGETIPPFETVRIGKDGTPITVSLTVSPIKDRAGAIIGVSKIARDITPRKRAEAERARLTSILEKSLNEIYIFDTDQLRFQYVNQGALRNLGYSMEQIAAMTPVDLKPDFTDAKFRKMVAPLLCRELEKLVFETVHQRADGSLYPVEVHLQCVEHAGESVFMAVILDITSRKKMEEERERLLELEQAARAKAEKAENRARFLARASADFATSLDYEDTLRKLAAAAVPEIADWCAVHMLDRDGTTRIVAVEHADPAKLAIATELRERYPDPPDSPVGVPAVMRTGKPQLFEAFPQKLLEEIACDADHLALLQSLGLTSAMIVPLVANERILGAIGLVSAESGRQFSEADLPFAEDLAARAAAAAENARLYQELRHANAAKDRFIAVLSHELRTPLNPVLMVISDLEGDETVPADVREQLTVVRRNIELEARLIDDLLDSTRIASGKLRIERTIVDAAELLRRAVAIVEVDARAKGVRLDVTTGEEQCPIDADSARVQQVFWNVVKNAVKFTENDGRVCITCELVPNGWVRISVQDNGIGIEPENLDKIFNAFEQGEIAGDYRFGGLGLGLTISKALVKLHGGSLTARSDGLGQGATFTIELPAATQPVPPIAFTERQAPARRPLRILLVEDHAPTVNVIVRLLTKRGYSVTAATSIKDALAVLEHTPIDLLISDVGLPDGTGRELMEQVRQTRKLPGIALSGYGTESDVAQSSAVGFSLHLTKPIDIDRLDRAIQSLAEQAGI